MAATLNNICLSDLADGSQFIYEPSDITISAVAFQNNTKLKSIAIPNATSIQANSFKRCSSLVELSLPGLDYASNSSIFGTNDDKQKMKQLKSITISYGTTDIGQTFSYLPNLEQLKLPTSLTVFKDGAFAGTRLSKLRFDNSIALEENCLSGMEYLKDLQFDLQKAHDNIGLSTCPQLNTIYMTSPIGYSKDLSTTFAQSIASSIKFQGQASAIDQLAVGSFYKCSRLTEIDLTKSNLTSIPQSAFYQCGSLSSAYFPTTVTELQLDSFGFCNKLNISQGFDLANISKLYRFGKFDTLYCYNIKPLIDYVGPSAFMNLAIAQGQSSPKASSLEVSVKQIGRQAFGELDESLTSISLSTAQSTLPTNCFYSSAFKEAEIKGTALTSIGEGAFYSCQQMSSISIPNSIKEIQASAFFYCESLTSFTFTGLLTSIREMAFYGTNIEEAVFQSASSVEISSNAFANTNRLAYIEFDSLPNATVSSNYAGWDNVTHISVSTNIGEFGYTSLEFNWNDKDKVNELYSKFMEFFFGTSTASNRNNVIFDFLDKRLVPASLDIDYKCIVYSDTARTKIQSILTSQADIDLLLDNGMFPSNVREV